MWGQQLVFKHPTGAGGSTHVWAPEPDQAAQSCAQEAVGENHSRWWARLPLALSLQVKTGGGMCLSDKDVFGFLDNGIN